MGLSEGSLLEVVVEAGGGPLARGIPGELGLVLWALSLDGTSTGVRCSNICPLLLPFSPVELVFVDQL